MDLLGKTTLITGGSSGIGKATAILFARNGADVAIIGRNPEKISRVLQEIRENLVYGGQRIIGISADVRDEEAVNRAVAQVLEEFSMIDILVNSAGITHPGYFETLPESVFRDILDTNYLGTLYMIRAVVPVMVKQRSGHIVLVSSFAGLVPVYGYSAYGPMKAALVNLGGILRSELGPQGIQVSVLCPVDTDTPQLEEEDKIKPLETKAIAGTIKPMSPEKVAAALFNGMQRNKLLILTYPDFESRLFQWASRRFPSLFEIYTRYQVDRAQKEKTPVVAV